MDSIEIVRSNQNQISCVEISQFLNHLSLERRSSKYTVRNYRAFLERFNKWIEKDGQEQSILCTSQQSARSYLIELQSKLSRKSLANQVSAIRSFFQFCQAREWINSNPFKNLPIPKAEKALPKFLSEKQARDLMQSPLYLHKKSKNADFLSIRDKISLELMYGAGLRVS